MNGCKQNTKIQVSLMCFWLVGVWRVGLWKTWGHRANIEPSRANEKQGVVWLCVWAKGLTMGVRVCVACGVFALLYNTKGCAKKTTFALLFFRLGGCAVGSICCYCSDRIELMRCLMLWVESSWDELSCIHTAACLSAACCLLPAACDCDDEEGAVPRHSRARRQHM